MTGVEPGLRRRSTRLPILVAAGLLLAAGIGVGIYLLVRGGSSQSSVPPAGPDPLIGRMVARCKIEARIGEGKTSVVYRATHTALGMQVAVKILHPEVLEFPEIVAR